MRKSFRTDLTWSDVTPKSAWMNRRQLMLGAGAVALAGPALAQGSPFSTDETPNSLEDITSYNNFYEFGTDKSDPARYAQGLTVDPWSVVIDGLVDKPGTYDLADLMTGVTLEERIYRLRCVEAWSMVVPWVGFELATLLNRWACNRARNTWPSRRWCGPRRCPARSGRFWTGPIARGCGWTRRCIR
jgi:methionine sulfoxide reductase catalytic subunit